jgi:polyferredoxin
MATSVVNTGAFLGAGILQPMVGWALDAASPSDALGGADAYRGGMLIFFVFTLLGFAASLRIRETYCRYLDE